MSILQNTTNLLQKFPCDDARFPATWHRLPQRSLLGRKADRLPRDQQHRGAPADGSTPATRSAYYMIVVPVRQSERASDPAHAPIVMRIFRASTASRPPTAALLPIITLTTISLNETGTPSRTASFAIRNDGTGAEIARRDPSDK